MFLGRKNPFVKITILPKAISDSRNLCQITNGLLHRTRRKKKIAGNIEDPEQLKQSWERKMKVEESGFLP